MDTTPRAARPLRGSCVRGFSQLELLITIALAGILSAGAVHSWMPQAGKSTAAYQALRLADDLRHTRLMAMAWGKTLVFSTSADSWRVRCADTSACAHASPAPAACPNPTAVVIDHGHHGPFCIPLENGVTLSGPAAIEFDLLGRPQSVGTITYQLMSNGTTLAIVSVAADTGNVSTLMVLQ